MSHNLRLIGLAFILLLRCTIIYGQEQYHLAYSNLDTTSIKNLIGKADKLRNSCPDSAVFLYNLALQQGKSNRYYNGILLALDRLGVSAFHSGDPKGAINYYKQALPYFFYAPDCIDQLSLFYDHIGTVYNDMGYSDSAIQYYYQTIAICKVFPSVMPIEYVYNDLATLFNANNNYKASLFYLDKAEVECRKKNNYELLGAVLINKTNTYKADNDNNNKKLIEKGLEDALAIAKLHNLPNIKRNALSALGTLNIDEAHYRQALCYLLEANKISDHNKYEELRTSANLAECYFQLKEYDKAEHLLLLAKNGAEKIQADYLYIIYGMLAQTYRKTGKYKQSADYYEFYMTMEDSIKNDSKSEKIRQLESQYQAAQKDNELIKKELLISEQKVIIHKKNVQVYVFLTASVLLLLSSFLYYKHYQRIQKQKAEIATWHATLDGEEKERSRLAKSLHDGIGGSLSTVRMWFSTIQDQHKTLSQSTDYNEAMQLLDNTLDEVRETAHNLMPELLLQHGLPDAIRIYCNNVQRAGKLKIEYQYLGYLGKLNDNFELIVYRIIQELIQNILKHAQATFALVQLSMHDDLLCLTIEDNGIGMDMEQLNNPGMGLQNVQRSVTNLNGSYNIRSEKGDGTTIYIELGIHNT